MKKIFLLRHGALDWPNGKKVCIGHTDIPMNSLGIKQAEALRDYFSDIPLSAVYTSDLIRCSKMAEIICEGRNISPIIDADFREVYMGRWEGRSFEEIEREDSDAFFWRGQDFANNSAPGGESIVQACNRALNKLRIIAKDAQGDIVVVSHSGINRSIICSASGRNLSEIFMVPQEHGCINELDFENGQFRVLEISKVPKKEIL